LMLHLIVGQGGLQSRVPIHHTLPPVHEPIVVHTGEHIIHTAIESRIHGITFSTPIATGPHFTDLFTNGVLTAFHIMSNPLQELFPPQTAWISPTFFLLNHPDHHTFHRNR